VSGQPAIVPARRSRKLQVWVDFDERERWRAAAEAEGINLSAWLRRAANRQRVVEARRKDRDAKEVKR
jgi:hypothetical protein